MASRRQRSPLGTVKVGDRVRVAMRAGSASGTVEFEGPTEFGSGTWIGVALDAAHGKHDGTGKDGVRYFHCRDGHGVFVRAAKVSPWPGVGSGGSASPQRRSPLKGSLGSGDSGYWDYREREATSRDLGHSCRECKLAFSHIGEPIAVRRGARIEMRYHVACFSGAADPRSQNGSSYTTGHLAGTQSHLPPAQPFHKMRTASHW